MYNIFWSREPLYDYLNGKLASTAKLLSSAGRTPVHEQSHHVVVPIPIGLLEAFDPRFGNDLELELINKI